MDFRLFLGASGSVAFHIKIVLWNGIQRLVFKDAVMNSAQDALYQLHRLEAERLGYVPVPYDKFCARLQKTADITGMLLPPSALNIKIQAKTENHFKLTRLYI